MDSNSHQSKSKNKTEDTKTVKNNRPATTTKEKQTQMAEGSIPLCPDGDEPYQILSPSGKPEHPPSPPKSPQHSSTSACHSGNYKTRLRWPKAESPFAQMEKSPIGFFLPAGDPRVLPVPQNCHSILASLTAILATTYQNQNYRPNVAFRRKKERGSQHKHTDKNDRHVSHITLLE